MTKTDTPTYKMTRISWSRRRLLAGVSGIVALSGCMDILGDDDRSLPEPARGTWSQSAHDARNSASSDITVPDRGTPAWNAGDATTIPPLIVGETVYSIGDELVAVDSETGSQQWQADLDSESSSVSHIQPAVANGRVLLGSEGQIRAFDSEDGSELWTRSIDGYPLGPITVDADDRIGIIPFERPVAEEPVVELVAFAVTSGETEWTTPLLTSGRMTPPAIVDNRVYAAGYASDETPIIRCLEADTGELVWEREVVDPSTSPVATRDGVAIGDDGTLVIHGLDDGDRRAALDVIGREIRAIAIDDETAFVLSSDGLTAMWIPDGTERWSVRGTTRADGVAVGRNTVVAPISSDVFDLDTSWPCIAAFDRADGAVRWYYAVDDSFDPAIGAPPVIADGAVFAMTNTRSGITALGDLPPEDS